ncbi:MAG: hypothetical protein FJ102_04045 [Deltaproteobacteria bacterium]|nr:hypothetical protein [Deltaproteobacteria bacterium]
MAVCYTKWTVLPHEPLVELASNLWRVEGKMEGGTRRTMTLARLKDGRIVINNAIALEDELMAKIDQWGEVAAILVPNAFHRQDVRIMHERYPNAKVFAPARAIGAAKKATEIAGSFADAPQDATVRISHVGGMKEREGVIEVSSDNGVTQVYCDVLLNMPPMSGFFGFLLHPTGQFSVPRFMRWFMVSKTAETRAHLERLASTDGLRRIIPGHGNDIVGDDNGRGAGEKLREALKSFD